MERFISYTDGREQLLQVVSSVGLEKILLKDCSGRILGQDVIAKENIPPFDRSPYDGYAFRSEDVQNAAKNHPITLKILEEIAAGSIPHFKVTEGCAVKILTGAPIPEGADAVVMFEMTEFTEDTVTLFEPVKPGSNIIFAGEDVKKGNVLAKKREVIDPGLMGTLAGQNISHPYVYQMPKVGIISTGSELLDVGEELEDGKIYNSNQYAFCAALKKMGCDPVILGRIKDDTASICKKILEGLESCDALLMTGGVSVGDYDLTPAAMEMADVEILFRGVGLKPGMACAYGHKNGKIICGLSGNPASSLINFYAVAYPAFRKLCGYQQCIPKEFDLKLSDTFPKKSSTTRILRGKLEIREGIAYMQLPQAQGNVQLSSTIGCDVMAIIPEGSGPIPANTQLKGFMI